MAMWYPKDLDFKGNISKPYEVKVTLSNKLLGNIKGKWNEAAVLPDS